MVYSDGNEYHIDLKKGDVGNYVILPGDPGRCEKIARLLENPRHIVSNREYTTYTGTLNGETVSVVSTGIGGPSAAIALEELANCGAHTFIRVGTSGGMQAEILSGDVVVATGAIRYEGTTKEYAPLEFPAVANFQLVGALEAAARKNKTTFHTGVVHCKDSFYGQHSPESMPKSYELTSLWEAWKRCGALASEMESAALFIVGAVRKLRVGTVLLVIGNQVRRELGLEDLQCHDTDIAIKIAVDAMKCVIEADKQNKKLEE